MDLATLKTTLALWTDRSDIASGTWDALINSCIAEIERAHNLQYMERTATGTFAANYLSVPDGFKSSKSFYITSGSSRYIVVRKDSNHYQASYSGTNGIATEYARIYDSSGASKFYFEPNPNTYAYVWTYFVKSEFGGSVTSHWLVTNAWDVVLYGTLVEAEPFLKNDPRMPLWKARFAEKLKSLIDMFSADEVGSPGEGVSTDYRMDLEY